MVIRGNEFGFGQCGFHCAGLSMVADGNPFLALKSKHRLFLVCCFALSLWAESDKVEQSSFYNGQASVLQSP